MNQILQERVQKLSMAQLELLTLQLKQLTGDSGSVEQQKQTKLIAYVQGDTSNLKSYSKKRLPSYMVPNNFIQLAEFPRLPNGKINRLALKDIFQKTKTEKTNNTANNPKPSSLVEEKLIKIWEEILNFAPINIHDNFFEIGGDSILSIQIIAKARQQGMNLVANQIFEYQTIAELALFVTTPTMDSLKMASTKSTDKAFPLTPIQHWFFENHKSAPQFWNQGLLLKPNFELKESIASKAIQQLVERYDGLRLVFDYEDNGWKGAICEADKINAFEVVSVKDTAEIDGILADAQTKFDLHIPRLFQCYYFKVANQPTVTIAFIAHHLLVDSVSITILINDFINISKNIAQRDENILVHNYISIQEWSKHLVAITQKGFFDSELPFWQNQIASTIPFPTDISSNLPIVESKVVLLTSELIIAEKLLSPEINSTYQTKIEELILTALVATLGKWTDAEEVCLGLELYGRKTIKEMSPSETVGWLTSYFPLRFKWDKSADWATTIKLTKEKIRQVPNGGLGYGALRYLSKAALAHQPQIVFNYLGNKTSQPATNFGELSPISTGLRHPNSERNYLLEINTYINGDKLYAHWSYSKSFHHSTTINALQKDFENHLALIIDHCIDNKEVNYTPSDFPEAGLNQADLDNLMDLLE